MKLASVFMFCALCLVVAMVFGQIQSNPGSPPALTVTTAAESAPEIMPAMFTRPLVDETAADVARPELWRADYRMEQNRKTVAQESAGGMKIQRQLSGRVRNPLGPKINVDQQNKI